MILIAAIGGRAMLLYREMERGVKSPRGDVGDHVYSEEGKSSDFEDYNSNYYYIILTLM